VCHFGVKSLNGGDFLRLCGLSVLGFRLCGAWFSVMRCLVFGYAVLGFRLYGAWFYGYAVGGLAVVFSVVAGRGNESGGTVVPFRRY